MTGKMKLYYIGTQNDHKFYRGEDGKTYYEGELSAGDEVRCYRCRQGFADNYTIYIPDGAEDEILCPKCIKIYNHGGVSLVR